jgi:LacI family transcriptional regulator
MHQLLDRPEPPTGVFAMSDEMGFGALQALRERALQPGERLAIVGFDGHPVAEAVGLTTVHQPVRDIGRTGARMLLDLLGGAGRSGHRRMPLALVRRASSGVTHSPS